MSFDITTHGIIVEAEANDCVIELYINDIPVTLAGLGVSKKAAAPIHQYLVDGVNQLGALINPGDSPATCLEGGGGDKPAQGAQPPHTPLMDAYLDVDPTEDEDEGGKEKSPKFTASVSLYPVGAMAGDGSGVPLITLDWSQGADQGYPQWVSGEANLGKMFGRWHWQSAQELTLDAETVDDVKRFVQRVRQQIEDGEAEPILAVSEAKYREVALAYGMSAKERADIFRRVLRERAGTPDWIFETIEEQDYALRLVAEERMIECIGPDWRPIIRGVPVPQQGRFLYPMMIGKLEGGWLIMR